MARFSSRGRSSRSSRYSSYSHGGYGYGGFPPYVSVAEKKQRAEAAANKLMKGGRKLHSITVHGRDICHTWWGISWCRNLEQFGDFENRLPRGRSYLRSGAVIDLQIGKSLVKGLVQGSDLYEVEVRIKSLSDDRKQELSERCVADIGSTLDLLSGKLDREVMTILAEPKRGLFPEPREIDFECSCPDAANVCKHVAAVLYGIGVRFDTAPELFFKLRGIDPEEFAAAATAGLSASLPTIAPNETLTAASIQDLGAVFGIEFDQPTLTNPEKELSRRRPQGIPADAASPSTTEPLSIVPTLMPKNARKKPSTVETYVDSLFDPVTGKPTVDEESPEPRKVSKTPDRKAIQKPTERTTPPRLKKAPVKKVGRKTAPTENAAPAKRKISAEKNLSAEKKVPAKKKVPAENKAPARKRPAKTSRSVQAHEQFKPRQIIRLAELKELGIAYSAVQRALLDGHLAITAWRGEYRTTRTTIAWLQALGALAGQP